VHPEYHPDQPRECDDCGAVSTVGELTPQKRLLDVPAVWVCQECAARPDSHAGIYQRSVDNGWPLAARVLAAPYADRRKLVGLEAA